MNAYELGKTLAAQMLKRAAEVVYPDPAHMPEWYHGKGLAMPQPMVVPTYKDGRKHPATQDPELIYNQAWLKHYYGNEALLDYITPQPPPPPVGRWKNLKGAIQPGGGWPDWVYAAWKTDPRYRAQVMTGSPDAGKSPYFLNQLRNMQQEHRTGMPVKPTINMRVSEPQTSYNQVNPIQIPENSALFGSKRPSIASQQTGSQVR